MFYQKYRPQSFSQVFGNDQIVKSLKNALKQHKVAHSYLFYGPRGVGKTTIARLLAKALICDNYSDATGACLKCDGCKQVLAGTYPDLIEIDAASNNSVENIRNINEKIHLSPTMGKLKFYIIDEVHMLSKGAFNALLKTLEEPPKNTYFVLATTEPEKVIDTIKSRCQQYELKRASSKDIVEKLKYITKQEKLYIKEADLTKIAEASRGGFRDAETMLETVAVSETSVDEVLNTVGVDFTVRFFDSIIAKNSTLAIELINNVYDSGKNLEVWNKEILTYLRNIMLVSQNLENLVTETERNIKLIKNQAKSFNHNFLLKCLKNFNQSLESLKVSFVPTLPLEIAVLEIVGEVGVGSSNIKNPSGGKSSSSFNHSQKKHIKEKGSKDKTKTQKSKVNKNKVDTSQPSVPSDDFKNAPSIRPEELRTKVIETSYGHTDSSAIDPKLFKWGQFVKLVSEKRPSIATILKNCEYIGIEGNAVVVQAKFLFHKERLELPSNRIILIECVKEITGSICSFSCMLKKYAKKNLTDKNVKYVTINEDEVPHFESSKPKKDKHGEFAIPTDDESFVASPVTVQDQVGKAVKPEQALDDFSGEFTI